MTNERFSVSISEGLRPFLEKERADGKFGSLEECVEAILLRLKATQPQPRQIQFKISNKDCWVERLSDAAYRDLSKSAMALPDMDDILLYQIQTGKPQLAQTYAACHSLFGPSGRLFDNWKGSFSFPLAVRIDGVVPTPAYLINLLNFRSGVMVRILQRMPASDSRLGGQHYHSHDDSQFSKKELTELVFHLFGFLEGYAETCDWREPFVLAVPSNLILFGYCAEDKFFNRQFDGEETYRAELLKLKAGAVTGG